MKNIALGTQIKAYKSSCIGLSIESLTFEGKITKVNSKSIKVALEKATQKHNDKVVKEYTCGNEVTYKFWKTTSEGTDLYKSDSRIYGIIEL